MAVLYQTSPLYVNHESLSVMRGEAIMKKYNPFFRLFLGSYQGNVV